MAGAEYGRSTLGCGKWVVSEEKYLDLCHAWKKYYFSVKKQQNK